MNLEQVAALVSGTLEGEGSIEVRGVRGVHGQKKGMSPIFHKTNT